MASTPYYEKYKTQTASINDISKKYGFNFTRQDANRQAAAEERQKRLGIQDQLRRNSSLRDNNMASIDAGMKNAVEGLDRNYFQKYMNQAQGQTNSGLNSGIVADQNMRLNMNRQAELGDVYRDANLGRMQERNRYTDARLGLKAEENFSRYNEKARAGQLANQYAQQGFENALAYTDSNRQNNQAMVSAYLERYGLGLQDIMSKREDKTRRYGMDLDSNQFYDNLKQAMDIAKMNDATSRHGINTDYRRFANQLSWDKTAFGEEMGYKGWLAKLQDALARDELEYYSAANGGNGSNFTQGAGDNDSSGYSDNAGGGYSLGSLSQKYESNGNPAAIGHDSTGGYSYGTYQIATKTGTMDSFLKYLKSFPSYSNALAGKKPGTNAFNNAWKTLALKDKDGFEKVQHGFIKKSHYDPALKNITASLGFDPTKKSPVIQDVVWSIAVQHGAYGARNLFKNAGITSKMSAKQIISKVYQERMANNGKKYFPSSTAKVRQSVMNRFTNELNDALKRL